MGVKVVIKHIKNKNCLLNFNKMGSLLSFDIKRDKHLLKRCLSLFIGIISFYK